MSGRASDNSSRNPRDQRTLMAFIAAQWTANEEGYELVNAISESIHITEGTIYPLMKRLKDEGCITSYLVESSEGPSRKYYSLTDIGRKKLSVQISEWSDFYKSVNKILGID